MQSAAILVDRIHLHSRTELFSAYCRVGARGTTIEPPPPDSLCLLGKGYLYEKPPSREDQETRL